MRQKNVPKKITHEHKKNANGRVLLDISTIKAPKGIKAKATKPNWRINVDEHGGLKFSKFYDTNNGIMEPTCQLFNKWKKQIMPVSEVWYNNGGKNLKLEKIENGNKWNLAIEF